MLKYPPLKTLPVAKFWYQGDHTHPIRRTGLVVEWNKKRGYFRALEIREGRITRIASKAPVKTYRFDRIAKGANLRAGSTIRRTLGNQTTLRRGDLLELVALGV